MNKIKFAFSLIYLGIGVALSYATLQMEGLERIMFVTTFSLIYVAIGIIWFSSDKEEQGK